MFIELMYLSIPFRDGMIITGTIEDIYGPDTRYCGTQMIVTHTQSGIDYWNDLIFGTKLRRKISSL
jgi:hypothetical protein